MDVTSVLAIEKIAFMKVFKLVCEFQEGQNANKKKEDEEKKQKEDEEKKQKEDNEKYIQERNARENTEAKQRKEIVEEVVKAFQMKEDLKEMKLEQREALLKEVSSILNKPGQLMILDKLKETSMEGNPFLEKMSKNMVNLLAMGIKKTMYGETNDDKKLFAEISKNVLDLKKENLTTNMGMGQKI